MNFLNDPGRYRIIYSIDYGSNSYFLLNLLYSFHKCIGFLFPSENSCVAILKNSFLKCFNFN